MDSVDMEVDEELEVEVDVVGTIELLDTVLCMLTDDDDDDCEELELMLVAEDCDAVEDDD